MNQLFLKLFQKEHYTTDGKFLDVDSFMNEKFKYIKRDKEYGWTI